MKYWLWLAIAPLAITVTACGNESDNNKITSDDAWERAQLEAKQKSEAIKERAKSAIRARLKDPSSAEFRNVRRKPSGEVCGEVNAKNSLGGYTGFQNFCWMDPEAPPSSK